jgi:hypothetical protein
MEKSIAQIFEAAAKVGNEWSLCAFAMAALVFLYIFLKQRRMTKSQVRILLGFVIAVVVLASMPLIARAYRETHGVYRLRVTVEDPYDMPLNDARVTSSIGGEPKRVEGGWEFDIPPVTKPMDGKLTIYAQVKSAFLSGKTDVQLTNDYNLAIKVLLSHNRGARVRGRISDRNGNPVVGAQVSVIGYETEVVTTGPLGQFDLPAHAADGEQVQITAVRKSLGSISEWKQAGEQPVTILLGRK